MTYEELQKAYKNVSAELANAKVKIRKCKSKNRKSTNRIK